MTRTGDPPPDLIPVPLGKACLLLLTAQEYLAGIRRGKAWRRTLAAAQRERTRIPTGQPPDTP